MRTVTEEGMKGGGWKNEKEGDPDPEQWLLLPFITCITQTISYFPNH